MGKREEKVPFDGTRIKKVRDELGWNQDELADRFGIKRTTMWRWEKEDTLIPESQIPIIEEFIFTRGASLGTQLTEVDSGYILSAPLVTTEKYNDFIKLDHYPTVNMNFYLNQKDAAFHVAFEINDNNMDNGKAKSLKKGDIVLSKRVRKDDFENEFDKNSIYVLVKGDGILSTAIIDYNKSKNEIVCHSYNSSPMYQDFRMKLTEVKDIYRVILRATTV